MGVIRKFKGEDANFAWTDTDVRDYAADSAFNVTRQELITAREGASNFAIRYFEVAPGSTTSLDHHMHDHGVIIIRGGGKLRLGDSKHTIAFGDAIYIEPYETHQFENDTDAPLGFICVIPPKNRG